MAVTERTTLELPAAIAEPEPLGVFARPRAKRGWRAWVTTVDHKKIGIMYGAASLFFFLIGGIEALIIRSQLAVPNNDLISADAYNQLFTMHAVTMVFLFVMPLAAAFANYLIPLQIGARDVAFPRLNALSFWIFLAGGIFLNTSWFLGGGADCGWFCYVPNSTVTFSPSHGVDFFAIGLLITGTASLVSAINLAVTVLNMRAPGMTLMRMPVFTWMAFITQMLLVFAMPVITVALILLFFDRRFGTNFFDVSEGADPLLWQHLFWIFGHPEVYIIILPAFGVISEIIPTFSRKPLFGYNFMVFAGAAIGFMGWGVWAHHMFASGMGPLSVAAFSVSTMFIAVPTGIKIFNWLATLWGGRIRFTVPMMYAVAAVAMFTIGGLSGVSHSIAPADTQQTDTYYIVAHFHYVIFGGAVLSLFGALYFWWPKAFGYRLSEKLGKWNFWLTLIGFNLTFGPMHVLGLQGMSRRTWTYDRGIGFDGWNLVATVGAFVLALGVLLFLVNVAVSTARRKSQPPVGHDPWDARSLEWMVASPPPEYNFDPIPHVRARDDFWYRKYGEDEFGRAVRIAATDDVVQPGGDRHVHLPAPSYWPLVIALGMPIIGYGLIFNLWLVVPGLLLVVAGMYGWSIEPPDEPEHTGPAHQEAADQPDGPGDSGGAGDESGAAEVSSASGEEAPVG
ncbi:MAG: cytochrome c oxidase subunit 1 [Acidimicrobiales bacterium]|nr:MAG: cytochrome c oxidase subunit 1 [Acidimicrobiales bacterium]